METTTAVEYAGFWRRFVAVSIDSILIVIVVYIMTFVFGFMIGPLGGWEAVVENIVDFVYSWIYWAAMESSSKQATLGKMALGIVVTDLEGRRISFGRATARYFGKTVSILILFIGFIMAGFTKKKQALHDLMAGCLVVRRK